MRKNQKTIITIILIVLIILAGYWLFTGNGSNTNTAEIPAVIDNNTAASSSVQEQGAEGLSSVGVKVEDQNPGRIVVVNQVLVNNPSWVVIHEDAGGKPGNLMGARLFEKGSNSGVIQLLNSMKDGKSYFAVIHTDNGNSTFELQKDAVLKDQSGKEIMIKFVASTGSDKPTQ